MMSQSLVATVAVLSVFVSGALCYGDYGYYGYYDYPAYPYTDVSAGGWAAGMSGGYYPPSTAYYTAYYSPPTTPPTYGYPPVYGPPATARGLSTCPPCPECTAASAISAPTQASLQSGLQTLSAGECYCPYDNDWHAWALDDLRCQSSLRAKCQTDSRLSCSWLDAYYAPGSSSSPSRPFSSEISTFVYNDCQPAPACGCANLTFTSKDKAADILTCCQDLNVYAAMPVTSLAKKSVDSYCGKGAKIDEIQKWVTANLWHATCQGVGTGVFNYSSSSESASTANSQQSATITPRSSKSDDKSNTVAVASAASGIGGAALGGLVAVGIVTWWTKSRTPQQYGSLPGAATV